MTSLLDLNIRKNALKKKIKSLYATRADQAELDQVEAEIRDWGTETEKVYRII